MDDEAEARYREALERRGFADVRPLYRALLKQLRDHGEEAYEEAVSRYREEVAPAAAEADDPLDVWLRYGRWLAGKLAEGRVVAVDGSGRAEGLGEEGPAPRPPDVGSGEADEASAPGDGRTSGGVDAGEDAGAGGPTADARAGAGKTPAAPLLLHLPEDDRRPALALAVPARPTEHQEAARELLCG